MLKEQNTCQLCVFKPPLSKIEKNNFNITFFLFIHFLIESMVFTMILPCKDVLLYLVINSEIVTYSYLLTLATVLATYTWLIYSNPSIMSKEENQTLLVSPELLT
jgi:hypothetical protein